MDTGALYAALNALDMVQVKRTPNGTFDGLREGSETLPVVLATTNKLTAGGTDILVISDQAPNDADGRAVGTIYFQTQG